MKCIHCESPKTKKMGQSKSGGQYYFCNICKRRFIETPTRSRNLPWSPEEDFLLVELAQIPNLEKRWNEHAKLNNWPWRSRAALLVRLERLGEKRRDEISGWISARQLIGALGLSENSYNSFSAWVGDGLPAIRDGLHHKVFLGDFARWVLTPIGIETMSRRCHKDKATTTWLLNTIAEWVDKPNPLTVQPAKLKKQRKLKAG